MPVPFDGILSDRFLSHIPDFLPEIDCFSISKESKPD
jgi:hypothetical protein